MAKFKLQAGAELDLMTADEMGGLLDRHAKTLSAVPLIARTTFPLVADNNGNIGGGAQGNGVAVLKVKPGQRFDLLRVLLDSPAATPAAPITAGWVELKRDTGANPAEMFFPGSGNTVAPALYTDGDSCLRLFGGETLYAFGAGLAAGLSLVLSIQYRIVANVTVLRGDPEAGRS